MSDKEAQNITAAIISASHTAYALRNIRHVSHITSQREQNQLRKVIKGLIESLLPYELQLDKLDKVANKALGEVYDAYYEFLEETSKAGLKDIGEATELIKKYNYEKHIRK